MFETYYQKPIEIQEDFQDLYYLLEFPSSLSLIFYLVFKI